MIFDFAVLPAPERYKLLIGTVVPRPIALVATRDATGRANAAPFSFFNVMSHDPAIVVLGIEHRKSGTPKDTIANIRATKDFVVHLVDEALAEAMNVCATEFDAGIDEIAEAGLTQVAAEKVAAPRITQAPVALECRLMQEIRLGADGKRSIVVGEVLLMHVRDGIVDARGRVDTPGLRLIGRFGGGGAYVHLTDPFEMARMTPAEWAARKPR